MPARHLAGGSYRELFEKVFLIYARMKVFDLTNELKKGVAPALNWYPFNNGLVRLRGNLFLMPYRLIHYDLPLSCHPWKAWWEASKLFGQRSAGHEIKHRQSLGLDRVLAFDRFRDGVDRGFPEYDSTGFALVKIDGAGPRVIRNLTNLFGNEMNQDARICCSGGRLYLSYNAFVRGSVCMLSRKLVFDGEHVYLGIEEPMDPQRISGIEKNWVFQPGAGSPDTILYSVSDVLSFLSKGENGAWQLRQTHSPATAAVRKFYRNCCQFSLGSPPVPFDSVTLRDRSKPDGVGFLAVGSQKFDGAEFLAVGSQKFDGAEFLAVGHLKFAFKADYPHDSKFGEFFRSIDWKSIKQHGKYVYFMYFFCYRQELDGLHMTRISKAFIPTDGQCHLPYLLVFPMGLVQHQDRFLVSYGEGDVRCKLLSLRRQELLQLLRPVAECTGKDYEFALLSATKRKVLVLGYYHQGNTGDEAYKRVFPWLFRDAEVSFANPAQLDRLPHDLNLVVCGGGDIIGDYFVQAIKKLMSPLDRRPPVYAISVGLPYPSVLKPGYLDVFDRMYLRNERDLEKVSAIYPADRLAYVPDLVYLFPKILGTSAKAGAGGEPGKGPASAESRLSGILGVFLSRTIWHPNFPEEYLNLVTKFAQLICRLLLQFERVVLVPMGIKSGHRREDDQILCAQLKELLPQKQVSVFEVGDPKTYVERAYQQVAQLDYAICMRFHAHVFCTAWAVPFTSVSSTRKCEQFMVNAGLTENYHRLEVNPQFLNPVDFDLDACHQQVIRGFQNRESAAAKLRQVQKHNKQHLGLFIKELAHLTDDA
ncbi:MAG: polysaccharide pyruvyl transferase family protein [Sulfobacillus sp.]